jgi:hypothetical protein
MPVGRYDFDELLAALIPRKPARRSILDLPDELMDQVLASLTACDLRAAALACRAWARASLSESVWRTLHDRDCQTFRLTAADCLNFDIRKSMRDHTKSSRERYISECWSGVAPIDPGTQDHAIKLIMLGDARVGKATFMGVWHHGEHIEPPPRTVNIDFRIKNVRLRCDAGSFRLKVLLWSTAGQERYRPRIPPAYFKRTHGLLLMFDVTDRASFESIKAKWWPQVPQHIGIPRTRVPSTRPAMRPLRCMQKISHLACSGVRNITTR